MSRYELSPAAEADLEEIRDYLLTRAGRDVASRVVGKLRDAMRKVAEIPRLGHFVKTWPQNLCVSIACTST